MNNIEFARELALRAHASACDKAGKPYYLHVHRVAQNVATLEGDFDQIAAAYLHDIIEDVDGITYQTILSLFGYKIAELVSLVSKHPGESYDAFIFRIAQHPRAALIKLGDLQDNMDLSRLPEITERDLKRNKKYQRAKDVLSNVLGMT